MLLTDYTKEDIARMSDDLLVMFEFGVSRLPSCDNENRASSLLAYNEEITRRGLDREKILTSLVEFA